MIVEKRETDKMSYATDAVFYLEALDGLQHNKREPKHVLPEPGDRYWHSGMLRWLEFVGYDTKIRELCKKGDPQICEEVPLSLWLNSMLYMCRARFHRTRKITHTRERKIIRE